MSEDERRINPRKPCMVPVRFRVLSGIEGVGAVSRGILEGEAVNLSERGIFFRSRERLSVGAALELYFRLPRELTGRAVEEVRCSAHVVHVTPPETGQDLSGIGATVERFETVGRAAAQGWPN